MQRGSSGSRDLCEKIRDWYEQIPAVSFVMMWTIFIVFLVTWFSTIGPNLINYPPWVVFQGEVWRLVTATFVIYGCLNLIISQWFYIGTACDLEKHMGSVKYAVYFIVNSSLYLGFLVQALCVGLSYSLPYTELVWFQSMYSYAGLWGVIMLEVVIRYNRDPEAAVGYHSHRLWCCPATIKHKYYPWLLLLILTLIRSTFLDVWAGFILGYLSTCYIDISGVLRCVVLSDSFARRLEVCFCFSWLCHIRGFVATESSWLPFTREERALDSNWTGARRPFVAFSGTGYSIGPAPSAPAMEPDRDQPKNDERKEIGLAKI